MFINTMCGEDIVVKSHLGGTHPRAPTPDVQKTCALKRIVLLAPDFSRVAKTVGNHGGVAKLLWKRTF